MREIKIDCLCNKRTLAVVEMSKRSHPSQQQCIQDPQGLLRLSTSKKTVGLAPIGPSIGRRLVELDCC